MQANPNSLLGNGSPNRIGATAFAFDQGVVKIESDEKESVQDAKKEATRKYAKRTKSSMVRKSKKLIPFTTQKDPLLSARWSHCRQLHSKFQDPSKVECRLCQDVVALGQSQMKHMVPFRLIDHVTRVHTKNPIYSCRRCKQPCKSHAALIGHMKTKHDAIEINGEYDDYSNQFHHEIMSALSECFDWNDDKVDDKVEEQAATSNRSNDEIDLIADRARVLAKNRLKNGRLLCAECGSNLKVNDTKQIPERHATRHALSHMGKFLFKCRRCGHRTNTEDAIRSHLRRTHAIEVTGFGIHYTVSTAEHQNEIIEMLERCFGRSATRKKKFGSSKVKRQRQFSIRAVMKQLPAIREMHCRFLFIKSGSPSQFDCRLCSEKVPCPPSRISGALRNHIEANHLTKLIYRCRHCSENIKEYASVQEHVKVSHGFSEIADHFVDLSDDYHEEIMSLLSECFDQGGTSGNASKVEENVAKASEAEAQNQDVSVIPKYALQQELDQGTNSIASVPANRPTGNIEQSAQNDKEQLAENYAFVESYEKV